jgi:TonB family protein
MLHHRPIDVSKDRKEGIMKLARLFLGLALLACAQETLTNDSIIKMVKAGLGEDLIVRMVQRQPGKYSLTTDDLVKLKQVGVSEKVLTAMVDKGTAGGASNTGPPAAAPAKTSPPMSQDDRNRILEKNRLLNATFDAGRKAVSSNDWSAALASFRQASTLDPNQAVVWANLADAAQNLAKQTTDNGRQNELRAESLAAFDKAIALKPDDAAIHNNYALMLASSGNFAAARAQLDAAVRLEPQNAAKYYYNLGAIAVNNGRFQEACDEFAAGLQANPNYADNQYQNGVCLFAQAAVAADGKSHAPPGVRVGLSEYLRLSPAGVFAAFAKDLLDSLDAPIETKYLRPGYVPPNGQAGKNTRLRVDGSAQQAKLVRQTKLLHPPLAVRARIVGTVRLDAVIDRTGDIASLVVMNGHPLLVPAAMEAVKQWHYSPTLLHGEAVEVATTIDVNFRITE